MSADEIDRLAKIFAGWTKREKENLRFHARNGMKFLCGQDDARFFAAPNGRL